jgi:hypothetical protein
MFERRLVYMCMMTATTWTLVHATPIDNGVVGDPEIECAATSIVVLFTTQHTFSGHVYVQGDEHMRCRVGGACVHGILVP